MPTEQIDTKNFLVCNCMLAAFVVIGNLTLPSMFWSVPQLSQLSLCLGLFFGGVLVSEVVIVGLYGAFNPVFCVVRWAWSILTSIVCALLLFIGIYVAESWTFHDPDILFFVLAYALAGNFVTIGIGMCVRWFSGLQLMLDSSSAETPATISFDLMFLFKLTFAIALLSLVFKMLTISIPVVWNLNAVLLIVSVSLVHILCCAGLGVISMFVAMSDRSRKTGFFVFGILTVVVTLALTVVSRMIFTGSSYSFFRWWLETQAFFLGFACSLLIVFILWRWAGLRFVR